MLKGVGGLDRLAAAGGALFIVPSVGCGSVQPTSGHDVAAMHWPGGLHRLCGGGGGIMV
jgi:hypothetical protein